MRTRTLVGGSVAIVAAAIAAAPLVVGSVTQSQFATMRERATAASPFIRSWELRAYDRGYLGATASSELTIGAPDGDDTSTIVLEHTIRHAPVAGTDLARVHSEPVLDGDAARLARRLFGDSRAPLTVDVHIGLAGTRRIRVHSPATDGMREIEGGRVEWDGLEATATVGADQRRLDYRLALPGLRLEPADSEQARVRIEDVRAKGDHAATRFDGVWTGSAAIRVGRITLEGGEAGPFLLAELQTNSETRLENELVAFTLDATVKRIRFPGHSFSSARLDASGERIAPALLQAARAAGERAREQAAEEGAPVDAMAPLRDAPWGEIAAREPTVRIDTIEAATPGGGISISGRAGLGPPDDPSADVAMADLLRLAHGKIRAAAPDEMVIDAVARSIALRTGKNLEAARESATQTLRMLALQGLVDFEAGRIESSASYERGSLSINGMSLFGG